MAVDPDVPPVIDAKLADHLEQSPHLTADVVLDTVQAVVANHEDTHDHSGGGAGLTEEQARAIAQQELAGHTEAAHSVPLATAAQAAQIQDKIDVLDAEAGQIQDKIDGLDAELILHQSDTPHLTEAQVLAIARQTAEAVLATHLTGQPHISESAIRASVALALAEHVAEHHTSEPPPPPPPPPPPVEFERVPASLLILEVDPDDVRTFGRDRPHGQAWAAGNMFQAGQTADYVGPRIPSQHRQGYQRTMDPDGNVHAWPMEPDAAGMRRTVRYGTYRDATGQRMFTIASQFRHADGYTREGNQVFGGWRVNTAIRRGPGESDPCTFDSAKSGLSAIGADTPIGPAAPIVTFAMRFRVAPWMFGSHFISGPIGLHEPGSRFSNPVGCAFTGGKLRFWSKHTPTPDPIDYSYSGPFQDLTIVNLDLPAPGSMWELVIRMKPDRTGADPLLEVWEGGQADGSLELLHRTDTPFGYTFTDPALNRRFHPDFELHPWHEWNGPGSGRLPLWNFDDTTPDGNVIYLDARRLLVSDKITAEQAAHDLASFR